MLRFLRPLILCVLALWLAACGSQVELLSGLREQEANEVLAALYEVGITGSKSFGKEGVVTVLIPDHKVAPALAVLRAKGLPRERQQRLGDVFKKDGLVSSPLEERARYIYSLAQELENTLTHIDGVLAARVHIVLPEAPRFGEQGFVPSSASVFIKHRPSLDLNPEIPQIRRLVQNSIPNLAMERVAIVLMPAQAAPEPMPARAGERVLFLEAGPGSGSALRLTLAILFPLAFLGTLALAMLLLWHKPFLAWLRERSRPGRDA